jgi:hypothetical protein
MAFSLSKKDKKTIDEHAAKIEDARAKLDDAIGVANEAVEAAVAKANEAVRAFNVVLEEAEAFVSDLASTFRDDYDEKSDKWKESENGESASSFVEEFENVSFEEIEAFALPELEVENDVDDLADKLRDLPTEANY